MPAKRRNGKRQKRDVFYLSNFPRDLQDRCEGIAGFLGKTTTEFVAAILEEQTKDLIEVHDSVKRRFQKLFPDKKNVGV